MKHTGSCHCQNIKFEYESDLAEGLSCNCSICQRRGHILSFGPMSNFKILQGADKLTDYQWGKKTIHFTFCSDCGCAPFGRGMTPKGEMIAVNMRCLENIDLKSVKIVEVDGLHQL